MTDKAHRFFSALDQDGNTEYYKVYSDDSWQRFLMPESTDNTNNVILEWRNGGINFFARVEDSGWTVEEVTETQIKAAIFTLAL